MWSSRPRRHPAKRVAKRKGRAFQAPKPRATLAYVRPGGDHAEVKAGFMYCAMRSMLHELGQTGAPLGLIDQQCASGQLVEARNQMVEFFLDTDVEWLWCVDSDMTFVDSTVTDLIAAADKDTRPIMGALCFGLRLESTDTNLLVNKYKVFPTIYVWREHTNDAGEVTNVGFEAINDYPRDTVVECDATGAACFIVHRTVLEKIRDELGPVWFDRLDHPLGKTFGEDLSFFARCHQVGYPVHVDTSIRTGHDKGGVCLDESYWDAIQITHRVQSGKTKEVPAQLLTAGDQPDS